MKVEFYGHVRQYRNIQKEIDANIQQVLLSGQYVMGPMLKRFEEELTTFAETSHPAVLNTLRDKKSIDDDLKAKMREAVEDFKATRWETATAAAA